MNRTQHNPMTHNLSSFYTDENLDIGKFLLQLYRYIWPILGVALCSAFIAFLYTFTIQPQYQTLAVLQVHQQLPTSNIIGKLGLFKNGKDSTTEIQQTLMRSRYILEPVIRANALNVVASPSYFPLFGAWMARRYAGDDVAKPFLGIGGPYSWGGEKVDIAHFTIPKTWIGRSFQLVTGKNQTYQLFTSDGKLFLNGKVGQFETDPQNPDFALQIDALKARPGTKFSLSYQSPIPLVTSLSRRLQINNIYGDDTSLTTGIFQIKFTDSDPERAVKILNAIINFTIYQNVQQNAQEAEDTLKFLNRKLPDVKADLEKAENALNDYHIQTNTLSMNVISQVLLQRYNMLEQSIDRLKYQKQELLQTYTPQHPFVIAAGHKSEELQKQLEELKGRIKKFPYANQKEMNLIREVKIKNTMYMYLLNNKQQLEIAKAGLTSDLSIISDAIPANKISAHKPLIILMGFLIGVFISVIGIIFKNMISKTVDNPESLEDELQIPVQSVVPYSKKQRQIEKAVQKGLKAFSKASPLVLAKQEPDDIAVESIRSLRISLHVMSPNAKHHTIALMGSLSNIGKSFVSLNLAQIIADSGKRTLLIDADIRRGRLHRALHQTKANGLSEYLEGDLEYNQLIHHIHDNLYFITCGSYTNHPIELFQGSRFKDLLEKAKSEFDHVVVDTPPILAVADSVLISQYCETKLFIVSAGKDTLSDVRQAIKKAQAHRIEINSIILNHRRPLAPYGSNYYYRYAYGEKSN